MLAYLIPKLRYQFAEFLSLISLKRLGILSLPTCVGLRYGLSWLQSLAAFLVSMGSSTYEPKLTTSRLWLRLPDLPRKHPTRLNRNPITGPTTLLHPCITPPTRYRNINLFSIDYALRPRLRNRLTLGGTSFPRKPWASGE